MKRAMSVAACGMACVFLVAGAGSARAMANQQVAPAKAVPSGPRIEVVDAGAEPRTLLRYQVVKGSKEMFTITMRTQNGISMTEAPAVVAPTATVTYRCGLVVEEVNAAGEIVSLVEIQNVALEADTGMKGTDQDSMSRSHQPMAGQKIRVRVSAVGQTLSAVPLAEPPVASVQAMEAFVQAVSQVVQVLPSEAVGVGGKWKIVSEHQLNRVVAEQTLTATRREAEPNLLKTEFEVVRRAEPQDVKNERGASGAKMRLDSFVAAGFGESVRRLDRLVPESSLLLGDTDLSFTLTQSATGAKTDMVQKFKQSQKTRLEVKSVSPTAGAQVPGKAPSEK